ncbi:large-conductance mechanosensitive channel protein MscL [Membranicola marinus]|uniref:Large-conductance mechanosensitive channel n=1 Tax=Membranihabitans marinus TaxID=1227546 RepID=A0A953HKQ4_9BACT|nr:large-conductance mechanosensitive channel protein MscL [Membranihabitans marinus]MBY5957684.1 large-conductance mechanosensitive channel protein MscL [Membranihabitans marinus]
MKFWSEFKEFAVKGNMLDMAVGIIIGAAFSKIVNSLVKFVLTPPLSFLTNGVHLESLQWILRPAKTDGSGEVVKEALIIQYGMFLQAAIDFLIIAMTIFILIKMINRIRLKSEDTEDKTVPTPKDIQLLTEIRNLMQEQTNKQSDTPSERS